MKKAVILSNKKSEKDRAPFKSEKFYRCYEYFSDIARQNSLQIFSASFLWYDKQKKIFNIAWAFDGKKWKKHKNVQPDVVYDKTDFNEEAIAQKKAIGKNYRIINDPEFTLLAGHKLFASLLLPRYFKKYYSVTDQKTLLEATRRIPGERIVLKPPLGCGGKDVRIILKQEALKASQSFPALAQEFIDSSRGIKSIAKDIHDLRLVFVNDKLIYVFVREPAQNSYLANLAQGGTMYFVPKKKLPKALLPIIERVKEIFSFYDPKIYSIDFMFDQKERPWIVEFNTMPGFFFFSETHKKYQKLLFAEITKVLKKEAA